MQVNEILAMVLLAVVAVCAVAMPVSCVKDTNAKIAQAIEQGGDPIAIRCALGNTTPETACAISASKQGVEKK